MPVLVVEKNSTTVSYLIAKESNIWTNKKSSVSTQEAPSVSIPDPNLSAREREGVSDTSSLDDEDGPSPRNAHNNRSHHRSHDSRHDHNGGVDQGEGHDDHHGHESSAGSEGEEGGAQYRRGHQHREQDYDDEEEEDEEEGRGYSEGHRRVHPSPSRADYVARCSTDEDEDLIREARHLASSRGGRSASSASRDRNSNNSGGGGGGGGGGRRRFEPFGRVETDSEGDV